MLQGSSGSGTPAGSLNDLDEFPLSGSLPDIGNPLKDNENSPIVTVHRSKDDEEMEALLIRQKRARTPSPHSSSRSSSHEKDPSKAIIKSSTTEKIHKSKNKSKNSSKISLSRTLIHKSVEPNKKVPKSK